jgi:transposase
MSIQFFYEDGQGNAIDEYVRPEPMDYVVDEERYALETISSYTRYLHNRPRKSDAKSVARETEDAKRNVDVRMWEASAKRAYMLYTDQDKVRFFKLMFEKVLIAWAAAKQLGIHIGTVQRWAKMYEKDPENMFAKRNKTGRSRILGEEHIAGIADIAAIADMFNMQLPEIARVRYIPFYRSQRYQIDGMCLILQG